MRLSWLGAALAGVLCFTFLISCSKPDRSSSRPKAAGPISTVRIVQAEKRGMERVIAVTGTLAPQERSTLSAKVMGRIERTAVDIGSQVRQGDVIAQIDPRDYQLRVQQAAAALAEARAAVGLPLAGENDDVESATISSVLQAKAVLEEAVKNLERVRSLTLSHVASASELDTADAAHEVARTRYQAAVEDGRGRLATLAQRRAEFDIARKQLADATVVAPFDGAVQSRPASIGEYVAPGTAIATLVKTDPLRLRLEVPERESVQLQHGQLVRLTVEGDTNRYSGTIARLSPALNELNRMLLVEADVPSAGRLRAGLFARAQVIVDEHEEGLTVPLSALVTFAGIEKVLTVRDGKALEKTVTTGRRGSNWVEILTGLEPGTSVVLEPGGLRSGQGVRVITTGERTQGPGPQEPLVAEQ